VEFRLPTTATTGTARGAGQPPAAELAIAQGSLYGDAIVALADARAVIDLAGMVACPLSEWLHRGLREAGIPVVCVETRYAQRFLSSRPVKTDRNDSRGIAETCGTGPSAATTTPRPEWAVK